MSSFRVCPTEGLCFFFFFFFFFLARSIIHLWIPNFYPLPDPNITRMEFDYYHQATGDEFEEYYKFVRQVAMEDFELCEKAQDNLTKGIYSEGILNPDKETGVACKFFFFSVFFLYI